MTAEGWSLVITVFGGQLVIVIATLGGIWLQGQKVNEIKNTVTDPETGMKATHAVANSAMKKLQDEVARLNQAAVNLAAKVVADAAGPVPSASPGTAILPQQEVTIELPGEEHNAG